MQAQKLGRYVLERMSDNTFRVYDGQGSYPIPIVHIIDAWLMGVPLGRLIQEYQDHRDEIYRLIQLARLSLDDLHKDPNGFKIILYADPKQELTIPQMVVNSYNQIFCQNFTWQEVVMGENNG